MRIIIFDGREPDSRHQNDCAYLLVDSHIYFKRSAGDEHAVLKYFCPLNGLNQQFCEIPHVIGDARFHRRRDTD